MKDNNSNKSLLKLAKGVNKPKADDKPTSKPVKKIAVKPAETPKPIDAEAERAKRAKELVNSLCSDVDLNTKKVEPIIVEADTTKYINKTDDNRLWLEEQVERLTEESEQLRLQLSKATNGSHVLPSDDGIIYNDYNSIGDEDILRQKTISLFAELQDMHYRWGTNFIINPKGFMNRLIELFPYLKEYKTFTDD